MGNTASNSTNDTDKNFKNMYNVIDYIATYYILTMDFTSLSRLSEKEYCDNLLIITSDIIESRFNNVEITYLAQRIKNGEEVNMMTTDTVKLMNKNDLENLSVKNDSLQKKRMCKDISKFYIKIAHLFAAIVTTINPVYTYKDETGAVVKKTLLEKDQIPKNVKRKLFKLNICDNRIRALKKNESYDINTGKISLQPKICDMNIKNGKSKRLSEEPGIPQLDMLYLDDGYNYDTGKFTTMSASSQAKYMEDLKTFFRAFTGNDVMPETVKSFGDIELRDYNMNENCKGDDAKFKKKQTVSKDNALFNKYGEHIKDMIKSAGNQQSKLLSVINDIFTYVVDPKTKKRVIRINPKLNEKNLQPIVDKTRQIIVDLYVTCETDYLKGIKLYEAMVETIMIKTTESQIENADKELKKITTTYDDKVKSQIPQIKPNIVVEPIQEEYQVKEEYPMQQEYHVKEYPIQESRVKEDYNKQVYDDTVYNKPVILGQQG
jgi:hypothetical protein